MDQRLKNAAEEGDINGLYTLLAEDPYLLERIDQIPIVDTPLHIAASVGQTHFVMEIANLKPSLARKLNHIGLSPMHLALQNRHIQTVRGLVRVDRELIRVKGREMITPLHLAAEMDDVDLLAEFLSSCPSSIEDLTIRLETAVHIAVKNNRRRALEVMLGWLGRVNREEVLGWKDEEGNTALHIAYINEPESVNLLLKTCTKHERLEKAAKEGNINELYTLLAEDPNLLESIDKKPIVHTPLHIAASVGQTHFVKESANLKPSLARKLNHIGLSPMHLALQNGHNQTVRELVRVDSELIRVRGREMITPLHLAAELDDVDLLAEFLSSCPSSMEDLTIRLETAVHIAVKNNSLRAFKVMFGWLRRVNMEKVLNWKDEEGNSVLHIATSTNQPMVMKALIKHVNINAKNLSGFTAMDIFLQAQGQSDQNRNVGGDILRRAKAKRGSSLPELTTLAQSLSRELLPREKLVKLVGLNDLQKKRKSGRDVSEATLVVAVLIVTATYQAALTPPGGYWQDDSNPPPNTTTIIYSPVNISTPSLYTPAANITTTSLCGNQSQPHHAGQIIMDPIDACLFCILNAVAFYTSIFTITILITKLPRAQTYAFFVSLFFLMCSYFFSVSINFTWETNTSSFVAEAIILLSWVFTVTTSYICFSSNLFWDEQRRGELYLQTSPSAYND